MMTYHNAIERNNTVSVTVNDRYVEKKYLLYSITLQEYIFTGG